MLSSAQVLANETAIKDLGLTPESFFVVFVSKAVAPKAPKPAEKAPVSTTRETANRCKFTIASLESPPLSPQEAETQNKPAQAAPAEAAPAQTPQPAAPSQPAAAAAPAAQAVDPEMESKIASIAEMGFERQDIVRALRCPSKPLFTHHRHDE